MSDAPNVVYCGDCKNWYDRKLPACPTCDRERSEHNEALVAAKLNGALNAQLQNANADARAEQQFRTAHRTNNMDLANRPLSNYPGYGSLVQSIKRQLNEG